MTASISSNNLKTIHACLSSIKDSETFDPTPYIQLGMHSEDHQGMETMRQKVIDVLDPNALILPRPRDPGVFYIYKLELDSNLTSEEKAEYIENFKIDFLKNKPLEQDPVAVFKIGSKRANMELAARKIACMLGLQDQTIPGMFFSVKNPDFSDWSEVEEDLWSGHIKSFSTEETFSGREVIGILEPFIKVTKSKSHEKAKDTFAWNLLFALAVGLRDAKPENLKVDTEECMPKRVDPKHNAHKAYAATHLPFLNSSFTYELIRKKCFSDLKDCVSSWEISTLVQTVKKITILFADMEAETSDPSCGDITIKDQGNCTVTVVDGASDRDDGLYSAKQLSEEKETRLFDAKQIKAFKTRLERLQEVMKRKKLTPFGMVNHIDSFYAKSVRIVGEVRKRALSCSDKSLARCFSSTSPYDIVGRSPTPQMRRGSSMEDMIDLLSAQLQKQIVLRPTPQYLSRQNSQ